MKYILFATIIALVHSVSKPIDTAQILAAEGEMPHPPPGPPDDDGTLADGAQCFRLFECHSECCMPQLNSAGKVAEYDDAGFPIKYCEPDNSICEAHRHGRYQIWIIIVGVLILLGCSSWCCYQQQQKKKEIHRLKYKLMRAQHRVGQAKEGKVMSPTSYGGSTANGFGVNN